jgi:hypothetical protein
MTSLAAFAVVLAFAVPTPKDAKENEPAVAPTGPAPRLLFVKADADGKVRIPAQMPGGAVAVQIQIGAAGGGGGGGAQVVQRAFGGIGPVELKNLKELSVTTTSGAKLDVEEATKRLAAGGFVLQSSDGKAIAPEWLRLFRSDSVLVIASPDLVAGGGVQIFPANPLVGVGGALPLPAAPLPPPAPKKE